MTWCALGWIILGACAVCALIFFALVIHAANSCEDYRQGRRTNPEPKPEAAE